MSNQDAGSPADKVCVACGAGLHAGAVKCAACSTYQDKRRFIFQWSGVIAAILAVVPAWGLAVSAWELAFPGKAEISLEPTLCSPDRTLVLAHNDGGQAGLVGRPEIRLKVDGVEEPTAFKAETPQTDFVVQPGEIREFEYSASLMDNPVEFPKHQGQNCEVLLLFSLHGGKGRSVEESVSCPCVR